MAGGLNRVEDALGSSVGALARACGRHPVLVIVSYLLVTAVFAGGLTQIHVRSADYDLLPNGHPSTLANQRTLPEVPGFRSIETMWVQVRDPARQNITGEQEIRALEEAQRFIEERVPGIRYSYNLAYLVKLINYTASGVPSAAAVAEGAAGGGVPPPPEGLPGLPGPLANRSLPAPLPAPPSQLPPSPADPALRTAPRPPDLAAFALPPDSPTFQRNWDIVYNAARGAVDGAVDERYTGTLLVFMYDINLTRAGPSAVIPESQRFLAAVDDFRFRACAESRFRTAENEPVLDCGHVYILGEAINAHMTALADEDFRTWAPVVFVATLLVLLLAFGGDLVSTFIAFVAFSLGLVWTYGVMGYAGIPLTFFGLLIVPITLGVGKEYAIYITNQIIDYGSRAMPLHQVLDLSGRRAGGALLVSSITSVAGLATMYLAEFKIMQDLAVLSIVAFASLFLISVTFIPAAHALRRSIRGKPFRPSRAMGRLGAAVARRKLAIAAVLVAGTVLLAVESTRIEDYFGISGGFREGDYLEVSYQYYNDVLGGSGTELVVVEGDIAHPESLDYLRALDASFRADKVTVPKSSNVNSLIIALETYYALKDGLLNPVALNPQLNRSSIPRDRDAVFRDVQANLHHPVYGHATALFTGPSVNIAVTHVFYHIRSETFDGLERDWEALNAALDRVPRPPSIREVNLVGTQDTFYLYVKHGQPWLGKVTVFAAAITLAIAALVLRRPRDIAAVMVPMLMAGVWWAGLLPLFGIKASLTLMLPTVFLISVGSDYAIQYVWNHRQIGDMGEVYANTGKANLYVVASTVIAFLFFVPMKLVLSSQGALAAALAIAVIFVLTTLAVPLFYPRSVFGRGALPRPRSPRGRAKAGPKADAPAAGAPAPPPGAGGRPWLSPAGPGRPRGTRGTPGSGTPWPGGGAGRRR